MAQNFVDTKLDLRTPSFDGNDAAWESWSLKFEAYCELVGMTSQMGIAAAQAAPIDLSGMSDVSLELTKSLYALLASKTDDRALALVSLIPFKKHGGARTAAMLRGVSIR